MIKFLITHPITKRQIFGSVLTKQNIELLQQNHPIHFNAEDLGMNEINFKEMLILYYDTIELAEKDLRVKGYITKDTIITNIKKSKPF